MCPFLHVWHLVSARASMSRPWREIRRVILGGVCLANSMVCLALPAAALHNQTIMDTLILHIYHAHGARQDTRDTQIHKRPCFNQELFHAQEFKAVQRGREGSAK